MTARRVMINAERERIVGFYFSFKTGFLIPSNLETPEYCRLYVLSPTS